MPFKNRIRLPLYATRAQFPTERSVFRKADGTIQVQSAVIKRQYEIEVDWLTEGLHEKIVIALSHDNVNIEGERYFGGISLDGEYEVEWVEFLDFPWGKAKVKVLVTPYNMTNSNCQTCEEASQLFLSDDTFPTDVEQSTEYTMNVFTNDQILCSPITAEIVTYNAAYLESATITDLGEITIVTKALIVTASHVKLLTYRVTCSNGGFDEADVYANLTGTVEISCLQPSGINQTGDITEDGATLTWTAPVSGPPADGYEWKYALADTPATIMETGTTSSLTVTLPTNTEPLDPNSTYIFSVRAACGGGDFSNWLDTTFITAAQENICGRYEVGVVGLHGSKNVSYLACNGQIATVKVQPFKKRLICALQNAPGDPVSIVGATQITYLREC